MSRDLKKPLVYLISQGSITDTNYKEKSAELLGIIELAVQWRLPLIQIREKKLSANLSYQLTRSAVKIARSSNTKILVNDRVDTALAAEADGVHLTSHSIRPEIVRRSVPSQFVIGVSTHSFDEVTTARNGGANFALLGPVFLTPGKGEPIGIDQLAAAAEANSDFPVLAVGGIDNDNFSRVLVTKCSGFAAIRFLNERTNIEKVSSELEL